ncbi:succinylglutamate desuccinylase/aspartoacylase family protein [Erythrobacter litoralis]|uniref:Succinylglutamate desuccinylase/Aspartoacylase catalytic domain-containing protein n=1 Tax=Erythrobacter litoralis (strain HTCC2594) TaxID=314225 RepID=Q2N9J9_ERYLH|nr:succinylglutamate desuccinylase/aspartoacylase family protein [Erythrobacter litoralis]ABC63642.1 hypothetical protein ELI_07750 [Erythrobacter litoralis HTCC2594]
MGHSSFIIGDQAVRPGTSAIVHLPITTMATGINSTLGVQVLHGATEGPAVFVSGAVHGDEIIGSAIAQRLSAEIDPRELAGTLLLVPVANIFGFLNRSRYLPDRRDLNRSFPGNSSGSLASQLAQVFLTEVIERCTLGIDIHSAAIHRYNLPQIRLAEGNRRLMELAEAFGPQVIIEAPLRAGSMRGLAAERGIDMLLLEAGEGLRFDPLSIETGVVGIKRVLAHEGLIGDSVALDKVSKSAHAKKTVWLRAPRGGVLHADKTSGNAVHEGDVLATVSGLFGEDGQEIVSPVDGIVIGHATLPVVHQGDALFHVAKIADPLRASDRIETIADALLSGDDDDPSEPLMDEDEVG